MGLLLGAVVLTLAWGGWNAVLGARDLQTAADQLRAVRDDPSDGQRAVRGLGAAGERTASARRHLHDPVLRALGVVPVLGVPLDTAAGLADAADTTVRGALLPLLAAAGDEPEQRLTLGPGKVDVDYLAGLAAPAATADRELALAAARLAATPASSGVGAVDRARADFTADLDQLRTAVGSASLALAVAPQLLAQDTTRRYLVLSQSPAEARGTGGLVGGYSLLEVTDGALRIVRSGPRSELDSPRTPVVDLGVQFTDHYGDNGAAGWWINSNLSPHFPYAAQIWTALWKRQYGEQLDGTLVLDPIALSYLLKATGPVPLPDGSQVSAANVVDLTLRDVYTLSDDNLVVDTYLQQISTGVADAVTTREVNGRALVEAFAQSVDQRRLLLWSADPQVQQRLADAPISGRLPEGRRAIGDVVVDAAGSKLDYYLERALRYTDGCGGPSRLALTLTNAAPPSGLPDYVTPAALRTGEPPGTNILLTTLYLPPGSLLTGLTLDGADVFFRQGNELGLEWLETLVTVRPGQAKELVATFTEPPGSAGPVERIAQPLVREEAYTAIGC